MQRFPLWHLALVIGLCILAYANSLSGAFIWDDEVQIVKNANLRSLSNIPSAFTQPFWGFATPDSVNQSNFYRPLQTVFYTLAYWWGGLNPLPGHVISIALHTFASIFVYLICIQLLITPGFALLAAALFATHPIHTEAVAWIAATPDVSCGAFYFASLWTFFKSEYGKNKYWLLLSAFLLLPALFSKEMAITLPVLLLLLTFRPGAPAMQMAHRVRLLIPYAGVTLVYLIMRSRALGFLATNHTPLQLSVVDWISLGVQVFARYVWFAVIPQPLLAYHQIALHLSDRMLPFVIALLAIAVLVGLAWKFRARLPQVGFWFGAFALLLMPVFYFKGISTAFMADRYLYVPSLAAVIVMVTILAALPSKYSTWIGWGVVALFMLGTVVRNRDWQNSETIFVRTLEAEPNIARIQLDLANILLNRGDDNGAYTHLDAGLRSMEGGKYSQLPDDFYRAHIGLGAILARARKYGEAREHLEAARKVYPEGEWSYLYLGAIDMEADNNLPRALEQLQKAVKLGPVNEVAQDYLGMVLFNLGRFREAKTAFEKALEINPTHKDARAHLEAANRSLAE